MSSLSSLAMYFGAGKFRDRFLWDGTVFSDSVVTGPLGDENRWFAMSFNVGKGGLEEVKSEDRYLDLMTLWDYNTNPEIKVFERISDGKDAIDPIVLWKGGVGSDYSYVVNETLTGAAQPANNALSAGTHPGTDITDASSPRLSCTPYGAAASWELEIISTHIPSGRTRTGVLRFEFV